MNTYEGNNAGNPNQQGNPYPQGNPYQNGGQYQQGNPYPQGNSYQNGGQYQQGNPYPQGNPYQNGGQYQQGNPYPQGNPYQNGGQYQQGIPYQQGTPYPNGAYNNNNQSGGYGGNRIPQKAPNIFKQFLYAFVPSKYGSFANVRAGGMIGFVTLLTFVATLIAFINVSTGLFSMNDALDEIPDFEIRNGSFSIEEEFYAADDDMFVYFTDEVELFTYDDIKDLREEGYSSAFLISKSNMAIWQNTQYQEINFSDIPQNVVYDKSWIINNFAAMLWVLLLIGMVVFFVVRTLWYFACAAMYLLFGMLIASMSHKNISSGNLFKAAVYAKVLMFVVALLFSLIPFVPVVIPGILKLALRFMVTVVFMGFAIQYMPQNR